MSRVDYDKQKVDTAVEELEEAKKIIDNINIGIQEGINTIKSARGIGIVNIDFSGVLGYAPDVIKGTDEFSGINDILSSIEELRSAIEKYNNASTFEHIWDSFVMTLGKGVEGFLKAGEHLVDGCISLAGAVTGLVGEGINLIDGGDRDWSEWAADAVSYEVVGNLFDSAYEAGLGKYSYFGPNSDVAAVIEGVGTVAGYAVIVYATMGAGAALGGGGAAAGSALSTAGTAIATHGATVTGVVYGLGGLGSGTESSLRQGKPFSEAFLNGVKRGVINGATAALAYKTAEFIKAPRVAEEFRLPPGSGAGAGADAVSPLLRSGWSATRSAIANGASKAFSTVVSKGAEFVAAHPKLVHDAAVIANLSNNIAMAQESNEASRLSSKYDSVGINLEGIPEGAVVGNASYVLKDDPTLVDSADEGYTPDPGAPVMPPEGTAPDNGQNTGPSGYYPSYPNGGTSNPSQGTPQATPSDNPTDSTPTETPTQDADVNQDSTGSSSTTNNYYSTHNVYPSPGNGGASASTIASLTSEEILPTDSANEAFIDDTLIDDTLIDDQIDIDTGDDIIIPTPTGGKTSDKKGSSVLPIMAGLGVAAAAGVGAKVYLDRKKNNDNDENGDMDEFDSDEEWSGSSSDGDSLGYVDDSNYLEES